MLSLKDFFLRWFWGYCTVCLWFGRALLVAAWTGVIVIAIAYPGMVTWGQAEIYPGALRAEDMLAVFIGAPVLLWVFRNVRFL